MSPYYEHVQMNGARVQAELYHMDLQGKPLADMMYGS
jgi:hypothetical protein